MLKLLLRKAVSLFKKPLQETEVPGRLFHLRGPLAGEFLFNAFLFNALGLSNRSFSEDFVAAMVRRLHNQHKETANFECYPKGSRVEFYRTVRPFSEWDWFVRIVDSTVYLQDLD